MSQENEDWIIGKQEWLESLQALQAAHGISKVSELLGAG